MKDILLHNVMLYWHLQIEKDTHMELKILVPGCYNAGSISSIAGWPSWAMDVWLEDIWALSADLACILQQCWICFQNRLTLLSRLWTEVSDFVAHINYNSCMAVGFWTCAHAKCVTQIRYLGPLPTAQQTSGRGQCLYLLPLVQHSYLLLGVCRRLARSWEICHLMMNQYHSLHTAWQW